jgi:tRNA1(Val) A37 N6-methylase TrmN6
MLSVPDKLFFSDDEKQPGIIDILSSYKFTIEENTPLEQEIALDPDLLGRTFESLLATYNPETKTTARNATGSFYTPREIVNYMVDESLKQYLLQKISREPTTFVPIGLDQTAMFGNDVVKGQTILTEEIQVQSLHVEEMREKLNILFQSGNDDNPFDDNHTNLLIEAISNCKIVDPACGSGAFPMGILDRMVILLQKLDKGNEKWKLQQLKNAESETALAIRQIETDIQKAKTISIEKVKDKAVEDLNEIKQQILATFASQDENYLRKLYLIEKCIYGVDVQSIAIEISKLRFFLSLLVNFKTDNHSDNNYGILPLPNLDYKLMQGNSLLESYGDVNLSIVDVEKKLAVEDGTQFTISDKEKLRELMHEYFEPANISEKRKIQDKIDIIVERYVMNRADSLIRLRERQLRAFEEEFKLAKTSKGSTKGVRDKLQRHVEKFQRHVELGKQNLKDACKQKKELLGIQHKRQKPYFLWHLYFMDVLFDNHNLWSGFDVVIGNPPYIQLQKDHGKLAEMLKDKSFATFERTGDIYAIFYEAGFNLLKRNGVLTYITSSQWQKAAYGESLRNYFLTKDLQTLINLGPGVFDSSVVDTNILIGKNSPHRNTLRGFILRYEEELSMLRENMMQRMNYITNEAWTISDSIKQALEQKYKTKGKPLIKWDVKINFGIKTGYNEAFVIDEVKKKELIKADPKCKGIIKRLLRGREIEKYHTEWDGGYLIATFPILKLDINNYKEIKSYLEGFLPKIKQIGATYKNANGEIEKTRKYTQHEWFETQDPIAYHKEFIKEKVIWKRIGSQLRFSYSDEEIYCLDSTCIATGEKIKYLTALLNSKLCNYQLFEKSPRTGMGDLIISVQALEPIFVHYPDDQEEEAIVNLFDRIYSAKRLNQEADTSVLENEIDQLVYNMYDLTEEEIKIVEGQE